MSIVGRLCVESDFLFEAGSFIRFNAGTKPNTIKIDPAGPHAGVLLERHPGHNKHVWSGVHLEGPINVRLSPDVQIIKTLEPLYLEWKDGAFTITLSSTSGLLIGRSIQSCNPSLQATLAIDVRDNPSVFTPPQTKPNDENSSTALVATQLPSSQTRPSMDDFEKVDTIAKLKPALSDNYSIFVSILTMFYKELTGSETMDIPGVVDLYNTNGDERFRNLNTIVYVKVPVKRNQLEIYDNDRVPIVPNEALPVITKTFSNDVVTFWREHTATITISVDAQNKPKERKNEFVYVQWSKDGNHKWGNGPGGFIIGTFVSRVDDDNIRVNVMTSTWRYPSQDQALDTSNKETLQRIGQMLIDQINANRRFTEAALAGELSAEIENIVERDQHLWHGLSDLYRLADTTFRFDEGATPEEVREALEHVRYTQQVVRTRESPPEEPNPLKWRRILDDLKRLKRNELDDYFTREAPDKFTPDADNISALDRKKDIAEALGIPAGLFDSAALAGQIAKPSSKGFNQAQQTAIDALIDEELDF